MKDIIKPFDNEIGGASTAAQFVQNMEPAEAVVPPHQKHKYERALLSVRALSAGAIRRPTGWVARDNGRRVHGQELDTVAFRAAIARAQNTMNRNASGFVKFADVMPESGRLHQS